MTIRYRIRQLLESKKQIRALIIFFIVILVVILSSTFTPLSQATQSVQSSLYSAGGTIGAAFRRLFSSTDSVQSKLNNANSLIEELAIDHSYLNQLEGEVSELKKLLKYSEEITTKTIPSKILARSIDKRHTILIDKGRLDGVRQELAVVVAGGHLIGKILEVNDHSSVVVLTKDERSKIAAKILGAQSTMGLVEGDGGFLLTMNFIPHANILKEGDLIVTSGLDGHIEPNLIIGTIKEVIRIDTEQFVSTHISPTVDFREFSHVLILDPIPDEAK